jgi:hypothetical protein
LHRLKPELRRDNLRGVERHGVEAGISSLLARLMAASICGGAGLGRAHWAGRIVVGRQSFGRARRIADRRAGEHCVERRKRHSCDLHHACSKTVRSLSSQICAAALSYKQYRVGLTAPTRCAIT